MPSAYLPLNGKQVSTVQIIQDSDFMWRPDVADFETYLSTCPTPATRTALFSVRCYNIATYRSLVQPFFIVNVYKGYHNRRMYYV